MQELLVDFENVDELYKCYMPSLKNGGLFVKTNARYSLGHELDLRVILPGEIEDNLIAGKVVWITPQGAQCSTPPGVGIDFISDVSHLNEKIIKLLGIKLSGETPTYTM
jgi:type IV pilus assembly protein PilZ